MIVVWTILAIAGVLVLLAAILVATPMHLRLFARTGDRFELRAEVRTLWGLSPRLTVEAGEGGGGRIPWRSRSPKRRKPRKKRRGSIDAEQALRLVTAVPEAAQKALRRIHIDGLRLRAAIGFDDPAQTGEVFGLLVPLIYGLSHDGCEVEIRPEFDARVFEGSAEVSLHLTPVAVAWPVLRLILLVRGMRT